MVGLVNANMARLLEKHRGYGVLQPREGHYMLTFYKAADAVAFHVDLQGTLLNLPWPPFVLTHPLCRPTVIEGRSLYSGPTISLERAK